MAPTAWDEDSRSIFSRHIQIGEASWDHRQAVVLEPGKGHLALGGEIRG